ncbi:MAG: AAA family ATPase [Planctomycetia bacterium]|nr:AAA family ATPase [Planctomycetia bacterium]
MKISVPPSNGKSQRPVIATQDDGAELLRDSFDPNSRFHRDKFVEALAQRLNRPPRELEWIGREIIAQADAQDAAAGSPPARPLRIYTASELDAADLGTDWLVEHLAPLAQPGTIAGLFKTMKTSIAADFAVSVAAGRFFLGKFRVPSPRRVLFLSAESGLATLRETMRRISYPAGIDFPNLGDKLLVSGDVPHLDSDADVKAAEKIIADNGIEVVVVDPLYRAVPTVGAEAGNLFQMGKALDPFLCMCQASAVTPIILHHANRRGVGENRPMELADIAWSGVAEMVRWFILLSRRQAYQADGHHALYLNIGGSAGQSHLMGLDIAEGLVSDEGGRRWEVSLTPIQEVRAEAQGEREQEKQRRAQAAFDADTNEVMRVIDENPAGVTETDIRKATGFRAEKAGKAIADLRRRSLIIPCDVTKDCRKKPYPGFKRKKDAADFPN